MSLRSVFDCSFLSGGIALNRHPHISMVTAIILSLVSSHAAFASGGGDILLNAHFDDLPLGPAVTAGAPSNPYDYTASLITADVVDDGSGNQVLEICDPNALFPGFVTFELLGTAAVTSGKVCVTYTVIYPAFDQWIINHRAPLTLTTTELFLQMKFNAGGIISFLDADDLVPFTTYPYSAGVPIHFKTEYDMDAGTYDLWVDDSLVISDEAHGVVDSGFGRLQFGQNSDFDIGDCFTVDDILVQMAGAVTAVGEGAPSMIAPTFEGASPNPFNPVTSLRFNIPESGRVSIEVFDVAGRLVKTLLNEDRVAGGHTVRWDGSGDRGREIGSGLYFARMSAGSYQSTRRMMLIR